MMALHYREPDRPSLDQPDPWPEDDDQGITVSSIVVCMLSAIGFSALVWTALWLILA